MGKLKRSEREIPVTFWVEFFKNPYSKECKELYKFVPELRKEKRLLIEARTDPKKRMQLEAHEDAVRNYAAALSQAREEGRRKARAEIEAGEKEPTEKVEIEELTEDEADIKRRIEKARQEKIETLKMMLSEGLPIELAAKYFDLSIEKIESLK